MTVDRLFADGKTDAEIAAISAKPVYTPKAGKDAPLTAFVMDKLIALGACTKEEAAAAVYDSSYLFVAPLTEKDVAALRETYTAQLEVEKRRGKIAADDAKVTDAWNAWSNARDTYIISGGTRPAKPFGGI